MSPPELPVGRSVDMGVVAATYPPLGQVSLVPTPETILSAVLEVPSTEARESWEASIWHSTDGSEWEEAQASPLPANRIPSSLQQESPSATLLYFSVKLVVAGTCSFTLKFRSAQCEPWQWIRDETGIGDGTIIVQGPPPASSLDDIEDVLKNLSPKWNVSQKESQAPRTNLWSLGAKVAAAKGETSSEDVIPLGLPWGGFLKWFSLARVSQPWIGPVHGNTRFDLDLDGILSSFLSSKGQHLVMLAVSGLRGVETCLRSESDNVVVKVRNDSPTEEQATVLVSVGEDFSKAVAAVLYRARDLVSAPGALGGPSSGDATASFEDVEPQWRENWYDGLGYCTWNSLGQNLSDQKLFDALEKLAAGNIQISSLIVDDNWQSVEHVGEGMADRKWLDFEAEPRNFPLGLKGTVGRIREKFPHIKHVAVWHALLGYWGGISPNGNIAKDYETVNVHRRYDLGEGHRPDGPITVVAADDSSRVYDDFYRFLSSCGVDGVKADAQCLLDALTSARARMDLTRSYLNAWSIASLRHLGGNATSCMALVPQVIFRSLVPCKRPPFACRTSNDFQPENEEAHGWHVWVNAFNGILARHLNVVPDWDMFQTVGPFGGFHAAARCLSGGPVYITDVPGEHDLGLIEEMTATTVRGGTVVLRPSVPAKAIEPYVSYHDGVLFKVGGYNGSSQTGTPILGVFNVSSKPITELLHLSTFPGAMEPEYIVTSHVSQIVSGPFGPKDPSALLPLSLNSRGYDILTAYPLTGIGGISAANLGLRGKMTGAVAVASSGFMLTENNRVRVDASLKALGILGLYISHLPSLSIADDFIATISGRVIPPSTVSISQHSEKILEIDVEKAWREVEAPVGWGNEVNIRVYFTLHK